MDLSIYQKIEDMFDIVNIQQKGIAWRWLSALLKLVLFCMATLILVYLFFLPMQYLFDSLGIVVDASSGDFRDANPWLLSINWLMMLLGTVAAVYVFRRFLDKRPLTTAGLHPYNWQNELPQGVLWGFVLITLGFVLLLIAQQIKVIAFGVDLNQILGWMVFFFIAAAFEEVLFRGYIQSMFSEHISAKVGWYVSAVLFGLIHMANVNFSILGGLNIILAGLVLGLVYLKTRRIWAATGLHFAWNYFQGTVYGFGVSGITTYQVIDIELVGNPLLTGGAFGFEGSILSILLLGGFIWWQRVVLMNPGSFRIALEEIAEEEKDSEQVDS